MAANLPDVFLLSVFKKLNANDRLRASQVCPNWSRLVRQVNQTVWFLNILVNCIQHEKFVNKYNYNVVDFCTFWDSGSIKQQLMKEAETKEVDREKLECLTEWNTLHLFTNDNFTGLQLNSTIVKPVITSFPNITKLTFVNISENLLYCKYLAQMLENDQENNGWRQQLTSLELIDFGNTETSVETSQRLFSAINNLPVLQRLAIVLNSYNVFTKKCLRVHKLPILARLKEIRFRQNNDEDFFTFLRSVKLYAADNPDLRIDLLRGYDILKMMLPFFVNIDMSLIDYMRHERRRRVHHFEWNWLVQLNNRCSRICKFLKPNSVKKVDPDGVLDQNIRKRIIRISDEESIATEFSLNNLEIICNSFPNLTSLYLSFPKTYPADNVGSPVFALISRHLPLLLHLKLYIEFNYEYVHTDYFEDNHPAIFPQFTPPLLSVRSLEFTRVTFYSHNDLQWLNLSLILPNLQAIHFDSYDCDICSTWNLSEEVAFCKCFAATLTELSFSTKVPLEQITVRIIGDSIVTAKEFVN